MLVRLQYEEVNVHEMARPIILRRFFSPLKDVQKKHERCEEIDDLRRKFFIEVTMVNAPRLCPEEVRIVDAAASILDWQRNGFTRVRGSLSSHPTIEMFFVKNSETGGAMWGNATGQVDITAENVVAWLWDFMSYERMSAHAKEHGDLPRSDVVLESTRSKIMTRTFKLPVGLGISVFENFWVWDRKQEANGDYYYVLSFVPADDEMAKDVKLKSNLSAPRKQLLATPPSTSAASLVRGTSRGVFRVTPLARNICELTLYQTGTLGLGNIPAWALKVRAEAALLLVEKVQERFRRTDRIVDKVSAHPLSPSPYTIISSFLPQTNPSPPVAPQPTLHRRFVRPSQRK